MRAYLAILAAVLALPLAEPAVAQRPAATTVTLGYLSIEDDPRHEPLETYANLVLRPAIDPFDGASAALREGRILGRALGFAFALDRVSGRSADDLLAGLERLYAEKEVHFFLVDAEVGIVADLAKRTSEHDLLLINVSATDDSLRNEDCAEHLLHTVPSRSMLTDGLAQYALFKQWRNVLLLQGPLAEDQALADAFERSATRFGAEIVERRRFVPTSDPREREQNNIVLLTSGPEYDAAFVADTGGEFGRYFPYQIAEPRPVVGSVGLVPDAWHWAFERHGAPQLNQRFERLAGRRMTGYDWAAWAAVRVIMEAMARVRSAAFEPVKTYLRSDQLTFDMYKGVPGSFRAWDNQLRQPILLHTHDAVVARAPLEGFLHPVNYLDTLGDDQPESRCAFRS